MRRQTEVRPAGVGDADAIAQVHVASWRAAYHGLLPQRVLDDLSVRRRAEQWRDRLTEPDHTALVAVNAGRVLGFASGGPSRSGDGNEGRAGEIYAIYLAPHVWGEDVGPALLDATLTGLAQKHYEVMLWVLSSNVRARRFYERQGLLPDGAAKNVRFGDAVVREVRYRRRLDGRTGDE